LKIIRILGIALGVGVLTSVVLFLLGLAASLLGNMGWIHLGEYQPWLPLMGVGIWFSAWHHHWDHHLKKKIINRKNPR
jgi:sterol desaturase/sphingolipid hydroxylase (fatty acid hydroxylase superfamily)